MGKTYDFIPTEVRNWVAAQHVFFVASAPLAATGHINCSPKGIDTFRVINEKEVAYLDLTGSGVETISHVQENGRLVIMFCGFSGAPKIVRFHGKGEVIYPHAQRFAELKPSFPDLSGTRAIIAMKVSRVSDSCGYAVPLLEFKEDRQTLLNWAEGKGETAVAQYRREKNSASIDNLPGYKSG